MSWELTTAGMEIFTGIASGEGAWKKKVSLRPVRSYKFQHLTVNTAVTVRHNQAVGVFSVIMTRRSTPSAALCLVIDNKQQRGKEISHFPVRRRAQITGSWQRTPLRVPDADRLRGWERQICMANWIFECVKQANRPVRCVKFPLPYLCLLSYSRRCSVFEVKM